MTVETPPLQMMKRDDGYLLDPDETQRGRASAVGPTLPAARPVASSKKGNGKMTAATSTAPFNISRSDSERHRIADHFQTTEFALMRAIGVTDFEFADDDEAKRMEAYLDESQRYDGEPLMYLMERDNQARGMRRSEWDGETIQRSVSSGTAGSVFETSMNALVRQNFLPLRQTYDWALTDGIDNYKTHSRSMPGRFAGLQPLPRGDVAKDVEFTATDAETFKPIRFARKLIFDEQDMMDDNRAKLRTTAQQWTQSASNLIADAAYGVLLRNPTLAVDSTALFHANHTNLSTGGGSAISNATIQSDADEMSEQTLDGVRLHIPATHLLTSKKVTLTTDILETISRLGLELRQDGRLDSTGYTDPVTQQTVTGSDTAWYLASDQWPTVEISFVHGRSTPRVRSFRLEQGNWGLGFDCSLSFGVVPLDFRGLHKADGA